MAIIDYHSIKSLVFAGLNPSSKILIPVLSCLCDDYDGSLSLEHSKHHVLALYAGLATSSVKIALRELHIKGIITIQTTTGHPAAIIYIPAATLKLTSKNSLASRSSATQLADNQLPLYPENPPQTPADKEPVTVGTPIALNEPLKINKQQPNILVLADAIGHTLVKQKIGEKGDLFVVDVIKAMEGRNGTIEDPAGYFVSCCNSDVIPWSREKRQEALAASKRRKRLASEEADRERWEQHTESVLKAQDDPDVQARVRSAQENFWEMIGEPEQPHNPPV